ncbi:inactive N-acetylated-alpha-linked acidic dipeptidase-like protein 2 [Discoglossus pictus]
MGLNEVQLVNYSVLLDLPGSSPNTITLNNGQCYYPSGQQCDEESRKHKSQESLYSYAAYSAKGTLEGEVIDVQYGTVEDLQRIKLEKNVTNRIALLKLGFLPLVYKISLLEEFGFGGALIYVDPCDQPETANLNDKSFMVSLNKGEGLFISSNGGNHRKVMSNSTSLLVQPVAVSLLKKIFSLPEGSKTNTCVLLKMPETENLKICLMVQSISTYKDISNVIGILRGSLLPGKYIIVGSPHTSVDGQEWVSGAAIMASIMESLLLKTKDGWRPTRTILFCSWGGTPFGNIGSYKWAEDFQRVLESNAVTYIGLENPIRGNTSLHVIASPSIQQLAAEATKKMQLSCTVSGICHRSNVSAVQMEGDAKFFINQLGIPAAQFVFDDFKTLEASGFRSEAIFITEENTSQHLTPFFQLHETIAKLTSDMVLQIASEPVLPFNALDVALEIQKSIEGDVSTYSDLMEEARRLREVVQLFQSNEMRPANDPSERDPIRVRMLNDVLQNIEKTFLVKNYPPGFPRNILYKLDEKTTRFSILQEAQEHCKIYKSNETLQAALQEVLNCISSAQLYFKESLHVFEDSLDRKDR